MDLKGCWAFGIALAAACAACGSGHSAGRAPLGDGAAESLTGDGGDGGGSCNSLSPVSNFAFPVATPGAAPSAAGGTLVSGTYSLASNAVYTACFGDIFSPSTAAISIEAADATSGVLQVAIANPPDAGILQLETATYAYGTSGTLISLVQTCDSYAFAGTASVSSFTATSSEFVLETQSACADGTSETDVLTFSN
jgi:hypothetical protein